MCASIETSMHSGSFDHSWIIEIIERIIGSLVALARAFSLQFRRA
jgi:hypothetical protein